MHHEKGGLIGKARLAADLEGGNAFLAGAGRPEGVAPVTQGNTGVFKHRTDTDGVLLPAVLALPEIALVPVTLTVLHLVYVIGLAVWAHRRIAPALGLHEVHGGMFIGASPWDVLDDFVFPLAHGSHYT